MLVVTGAGYQLVAVKMNMLATTPIKLDVPLSQFPIRIGRWFGRDVPISETIIKIACIAQLRTMLGHRPQVCYPANGWTRKNTEDIQLISHSGRKIRCLMHHFQKSTSESEETIVLNYYIVNGRFTDDEIVFSGLGWCIWKKSGN